MNLDTIVGYLNNMFASLPRTEQMYKLKQELLGNMEEKYHELKDDGKSENEAVGIVISEFGNIDELVSELGIGEHLRKSCFQCLLKWRRRNSSLPKGDQGCL